MSEPTRPGEIRDSMSLGELAGHAQWHSATLSGHRHGIEVLDDTDRAGHALCALVYRAALAERALSGRWVLAVEALDAGASHGRVADAMGLDVDELHAGLRSWARTQLRQGLIDDVKHGQVLALLGEQPPRPVDAMDHLPTWQLRRLVVLFDALDDPPMSLAERASLVVLAGQEQATVDNLAAVIRRVRGVQS